MNGHRIGYVRVSSTDQNIERQLDGIQLDTTYTEHISGASAANRPELQAAIKYARAGDMLIVHSMDRLARNLSDLLAIVKELTDKGACVQFVKENLVFSGNDDPMAELLLGVLGSVAAFERKLIRERQREGIAKAKARGVYKGVGKRPMPLAKALAIRARLAECGNVTTVAKEYGLTRQTIYSAKKRADASQAA